MSENSKAEQKSNGFLVFTPFGTKIIGFCVVLFFVGSGLFTLDYFFFKKGCSQIEFDIKENANNSNNNITTSDFGSVKTILNNNELTINNKTSLTFKCHLQQLFAFIYASLITSAITILVIEIFLRQDFAKELRKELLKIFNSNILSDIIKTFYRDKDVYRQEIINQIRNAKSEDKIKLICLIEEILILREVGIAVIEDKIQQGVKFQILVLDENSLLLDCLENTHDNLYKIKRTLKGDLSFFITLKDKLRGNFNHKNKFKIKVKQNIYSPICYFSVSSINNTRKFIAFIWMCIFSDNNILYPGFELENENIEFFRDAENHFEHLWERSEYYLSNMISKIEIPALCLMYYKICFEYPDFYLAYFLYLQKLSR